MRLIGQIKLRLASLIFRALWPLLTFMVWRRAVRDHRAMLAATGRSE